MRNVNRIPCLSTAPAATEVAVSVESHGARLEREINEMLAEGADKLAARLLECACR